MQLNLSPLLQRVNARELKSNDVQAFLDYALVQDGGGFVSIGIDLDLDLTRVFLKDQDVEYAWIYRSFMNKFHQGELDDIVEAKFFDPQTSGEARTAIIHSLQFSNNKMTGGFGGGGFGTGSLPNSELLNRLLIKSIAGTISDENAMDFGTYSELWYNDQGKIFTTKDQNSRTQWLVGGNYTTSKPKGAKLVTGRAAVIRYLLNTLCKSVRIANPVDEHREKVLNFANEISRSTALRDIFKSKEDLKIAEDIRTLIDTIEGEPEDGDFSQFVPSKNSDAFSGRGGGGIF